MQTINELLLQAEQALSLSKKIDEVEQIRVQYLGKKGYLTQLLQQVGQLPAAERPTFGQAVNEAKNKLSDKLDQCLKTLKAEQLAEQLAKEVIDVTLPGRGEMLGHLHPVTKVRARIEELFSQMGFTFADGPEIETEFYNFTALNIPENHPARATHDTFYLESGLLLRTHTSPVQIRYLLEHKPPARVISIGRVYRCDSDLTHTPMFHQLEGLVIDKDVTMGDLKGTLQEFLQQFFERELSIRFRPSYFPFTEPSAEVDMTCVKCHGKGCRICKQTGWLEILGCGMVHPNVLNHVNIDPEQYSGFAFGLGVDRLAMLRYEINDLRMLFENDLRFLEQF